MAIRAAEVPTSRGRRPHLLTHHVIGFIRFFNNDLDGLKQVVDAYLELLDSGEGAQDPDLTAYLLASSAGARFALNDPSAIELAERAVRIARVAGSPTTLVYALFMAAVARGVVEDREDVIVPVLEEAAAIRGVTRRFWQRQCESRLARFRAQRGDTIEALRSLRGMLTEARRLGDRGEYWMLAATATVVLALAGDDRGSALTVEAMEAHLYPVTMTVTDRKILGSARERLGDEGLRAVIARAATMSVSDLNDFLLETIDRLVAAGEEAGAASRAGT